MDDDPPARGFSTVAHGEDDAVRQLDLALVANLPAALGVKRGGVEDDVHRLARARRVYPLPGSDDGADSHRLLHEAAVTGEPGGLAELVRDRREEVARGDVDGDARVAAEGPGNLHRVLETVDVYGDALLGGHVGGDVQGEAVRVVEGESVVAGELGGLGVLRLGGGDHVREDLLAAAQGFGKPKLLALKLLVNLSRSVRHLGVAVAAHPDGNLGDGGSERLGTLGCLDAEEAAASDHAAE